MFSRLLEAGLSDAAAHTPVIQPPCKGHTDCHGHPHQGASKSTRETSSTAGGCCKRLWGIRNRHPPKPWTTFKRASILGLPNELLDMIVAYLRPVDETCLALTCRRLAYDIGTDFYQKFCHARRRAWMGADPDLREWVKAHRSSDLWHYEFHVFLHLCPYDAAPDYNEMVDRTRTDFERGNYWRCHKCRVFRARKCMGLRYYESLFPARAPAGSSRPRRLKFGIQGDCWFDDYIVYELDFDTVQAVMSRHFRIVHGRDLSILKCHGQHAWILTPTAELVLKYDFEPTISHGQLLLRSKFTFGRRIASFTVHDWWDEMASLEMILGRLKFWICCHTKVSNEVGAAVLALRWGMDQQCERCPTQYRILKERSRRDELETAITFEVFQNLGEGRSRLDRRWRHCMGVEAEPLRDDERDLRKAFESAIKPRVNIFSKAHSKRL